METVDQILCTAADYVRRFGWTQDRLFNDSLGGCLVGAIYQVAPTLDRLFIDCLREVGNRIGIDGSTLPCDELVEWLAHWNDAEGRTQQEVVQILDPKRS